MSSGDQDRPTEPSADEVTDPALQAEIANPAASNQPTGAEAAPGDDTTAADEGAIAAPGAPGELHSDETPPQGEDAGDTPAPTRTTRRRTGHGRRDRRRRRPGR